MANHLSSFGSTLKKTWPLLLILAAALFLRLYRLDSVPVGLNGDELYEAIDAWSVGWGHWPVFFAGNNGREALFLYVMAAFLHLFGKTVMGIRLTAVFFGMGNVLLAYLLGRDGFNRRVGLVAAGLTAVSLWPVMQSRWGLRAVSLTCLTALTLYLLHRGWQNGRRWEWVLGGLALGLTMYTYIPSRVFPLVVLLWFVFLGWHRRDRFRQQWRNMALSLLVGLLVFAPYGQYMLRYPDKVNQRINSMSSAWQEVQQGNFATLMGPTTAVLRMFTVYGDNDWRYHVAGKPVFDWGTGLVFYLGLLICIWGAVRGQQRIEKGTDYLFFSQSVVAFLFLLSLWLGAMLAPNALLDANSSFLRAAGAIVPVYLITAVGFDATMTWLQNKWPVVEKVAPLLILAGLGAITLDTWRSYFIIWNNHPTVREVYQADLAEIGRYLNTHLPPENTRVFVGHTYAFDSAPLNLAYYTDTTVSWFIPTHSFAWSDTSAWYFVPANEPLPADIVQQFNLSASDITFPDGQAIFTLYQTAELNKPPKQAMPLSFVDGPQLVGFDLPPELYRGDTVTVLSHWQITAENTHLPNRPIYAQVQLLDNQGNVWGRGDSLLGYPQAGWQAGDRFMQAISLEIPVGMPPGLVYLQFDLHDENGRLYATTASAAQQAGPFTMRSRPVTDFIPTPEIPVWDNIVLESAAFSTLLSPGLPLDIALNWIALQPPTADFEVELQLIQPGTADPLFSQRFPIWSGVYPPSHWQGMEPVSSFHRLNVPLDLATEVNPELRILLWQGDTLLRQTQGTNKLADLTLDIREHRFDIPPMTYLLEAQFGPAIRLLGYDLNAERARPGGEIDLTLYWQAIEPPPDYYTVFNHLLDANGQIQGQFDSPPVGDAWLTGTWLPGEVVIDRRAIPIRPGAIAGSYTIAVGLYTEENGRLPVTFNDQPQPDDQLVLTAVTVRP